MKIAEALYNKANKGHLPQPPIVNVFRAFKETSPQNIRVVIVGQDPTPTPGQASGMAFSIIPGTNTYVPTIQNILKELEIEGYKSDGNGDFTKWAKQGVLLLNSALTITQTYGESNFHQELWSKFTEELITEIDKGQDNLVWILWGGKAKSFKSLINHKRHYVLTGVHPSPKNDYIESFFYNNYFKCANYFLSMNKNKLIDWNLALDTFSKDQEQICPKMPYPH